MRENLFHGKRKDNGKWVEGYLFIAKWYLNDEKFTAIMRTDATAYPHCEISGWEEVDPETVGQYTGLTDKNGKKIFEGDIVHCIARMDEANCVIIFEEGEFRLIPERRYKNYVTGSGYHAIYCFEKEVIGNIHDNPELLQME